MASSSSSRALAQHVNRSLASTVLYLLAITLLFCLSFTPIQHASARLLFDRATIPPGWSRVQRADASTPITFFIALKQRNTQQLEDLFWAVSDPESPRYQQYLSPNEIQAIVAPDSRAFATVSQWLLDAGVESHQVHDFSDAIEVHTTTAIAEKLFSTTFWAWKHTSSGRSLVAAFGTVTLPNHLDEFVDMVPGLSTFPPPKVHQRERQQQQQRNQPASPSPSTGTLPITVPQFIWQTYNIPSPNNVVNPATSHGVIEFDSEYFSSDDLSAFGTNCNVSVPKVTNATTVGVNDQNNPADPASSTLQYLLGTNPSATPWFWYESGSTWLYGFAVHFMNTSTVPQVITLTLTGWEGLQCSIDGTECEALGVDSAGYVQRVDIEFQKMGVRGITVLAASGDYGAPGSNNGQCSTSNMYVEYPASSSYVTSVGGTEFSPMSTNTLPDAPAICSEWIYECVSGGTEVASSLANTGVLSGGGFSNLSVAPSYQKPFIDAYLKSGVALPAANLFNASGRGVPDVSAVAYNGVVWVGGSSGYLSFVEISVAVFAGALSLLNAALIKSTGAPIGFANPLLYKIASSNPNAFRDITSGDNICLYSEGGSCLLPSCSGYFASKGWDPVTGLGTPNYAVLSAAALEIAERSIAMKRANVVVE